MEISKRLVEHISTDVYDTLNELDMLDGHTSNPDRESTVASYIDDFLSAYWDEQELEELLKSGCDFWNDEDGNGRYFSDCANEYADTMVNIYYADLWAQAKTFQNYTEDSIDELGSDCMGRGITALFQQGEYFFWSKFANEVLVGLNQLSSNNK